MGSMFDRDCRKCKRDSGEDVEVIALPLRTAYSTPRSRELSKVYDVHSHCGFVSSSLCSSNLETFAARLFRTYSVIGEFCGFPVTEFIAFAQQFGGADYFHRLNQRKFLEVESIEGVDVAFSTEDFLKNQHLSWNGDPGTGLKR